ncbi:hypothetical protein JCM10908_004106 [Rhodotorula pacifica]|uniref:SelT/SelW/SelH family protein n=1 Tax=Rhodotorula pacifica TaxID=1495444 RepID=UPI003180FE88
MTSASTAGETQTTCSDCLPAPVTSSAAPSHHRVPADEAALLDASTFEPPALGSSDGEAPRVAIEFCDRCRWLHRATWTQTELFLTFPPSIDAPSSDTATSSRPAPGLRSISLVPRNAPETGGRFRVWLLLGEGAEAEGPYTAEGEGKERWRGWELVWDRKIEGGFPEMKELKQRIRNLIAPTQNLGHSDKPVSARAPPPPTRPSQVPESTPANTTAEAPRARPAVGAKPIEGVGEVDMASLADQPLKPLTAADFEPRYRCT